MEASTRHERLIRSLTVRALGPHPLVFWMLVAATLLLMSIPRLHAQDPLATARSLYASAAYDEALKALTELADSAPPSAIREIEQYRFLCLLALGRNSEARESIAAVVTADPLFKLDPDSTSPRVVDAFRGVRRDVLPEVTNAIYGVGKAAFDRKDYKVADVQLRKVIALGADPDMPPGKVDDLVRLSKGFLDLTGTGLKGPEATSAAPAGAPAPATTNAANTPTPAANTAARVANTTTPAANPNASAANTTGPTVPAGSSSAAHLTAGGAPAAGAAAPETKRVEAPKPISSGEIRPPIAIKQAVPPVPPDLSRFGQLRAGEIEVLIDQTGKVESTKVLSSIHPIYDAMVMSAAKSWRYEPATADGVPVKYRKRIKITITDAQRE